MGLREYVASAVQPIATENVDIYALALINARSVDADSTNPFLLNASLSDMVPLMQKQYDRASLGDYVYGLPDSAFLKVPTTAYAVYEYIRQQTGSSFDEIEIHGDNEVFDFLHVEELDKQLVSKAGFVGILGAFETHADYAAGQAQGISARSLESGAIIPPASPPMMVTYYDFDSYNTVDKRYRLKKYIWTQHSSTSGDPPVTTYWYEYDEYESWETVDPVVEKIYAPDPLGDEGVSPVKFLIVEFHLTNSPSIIRYATFKSDDIIFKVLREPYGDFYPILPVKQDFKYWDDDITHTQTYIDSIRSMAKGYKIVDLKSVTKSFKDMYEDPSEDALDDVYLMNGTNVYSKDTEDNKYLFEFFKTTLESQFIHQAEHLHDYNKSNQINVLEGQFNSTLIFRKVEYTVINANPPIDGIITYDHSWISNDSQLHVHPANNGEDKIKLVQVDGDNKRWSNDIYVLNKYVNGSLVEKVEVLGIQSLQRITIAESGNILVTEVMPNEEEETDYYEYLEIEDKTTTDKTMPALLTIPLDHTILRGTVGRFNFRELRAIYIKSFHFMIYGSVTQHVHWSQELRETVLEIITLGAQIYALISLGAGVHAAIAAETFMKLVVEQGMKFLLNAIAKSILKEVLGDAKGEAAYIIGSIAYGIYGELGADDFQWDASSILEISNAVLIAYVTIKQYQFNTELAELKKESEEPEATEEEILISPTELASEFISRTTNGALVNMAGRHLIKSNLVKETQGNQYPGFTQEEISKLKLGGI